MKDKSKRVDKQLWHKQNKPIAYKFTKGKCSQCNHIGKFSIHHKHYRQINGKGIYSYSFEELYEMDVVSVLCYTCHKKEHIGDNLEPCHYCGKPASKARSKTLNIPIFVCKPCFKSKGKSKGNYNLPNNQLNLFG
jgi:hypothetical protein